MYEDAVAAREGFVKDARMQQNDKRNPFGTGTCATSMQRRFFRLFFSTPRVGLNGDGSESLQRF